MHTITISRSLSASPRLTCGMVNPGSVDDEAVVEILHALRGPGLSRPHAARRPRPWASGRGHWANHEHGADDARSGDALHGRASVDSVVSRVEKIRGPLCMRVRIINPHAAARQEIHEARGFPRLRGMQGGGKVNLANTSSPHAAASPRLQTQRCDDKTRISRADERPSRGSGGFL